MQKASCENCAWRDGVDQRKCSYCGMYSHLKDNVDGMKIINAYWDGNPVIEKLSNGYYYVGFDNSHYNGLLHFTCEVAIWFRDGEFLSAYECACGEDWTYSKDEVDEFNGDHPGIIDLALRLIKEKENNDGR